MMGDRLQARSRTGREEPWEAMRVSADVLMEPYKQVNPSKAERLRDCATLITQQTYLDGTIRHVASYCRVRLCPICSWQRTKKVSAQVHQIIEGIQSERKIRFLFLTLTVRNCLPDELSDTLTHMFQSFVRLSKTKNYMAAALGHCRSMEVTHNLTNDTYHPHLHVLIAVDPDYFSGRTYLKHDKWMAMWRKALRVDYDPSVRAQAVTGKTFAAIAEVAKYSVKQEDYIIPDNWEFTVDTVRVLDAALHKRRFIAFGGIFKDWHKRLNLSDPDGDPTMDKPQDMEPIEVHHFAWFRNYQQYREISLSDKVIGSSERMLP